MSDLNKPDIPEGELPQEVVAELRRRYVSSVTIPEAVDRAVLQDAQSVLHPPQPSQPNRRTWLFGVVTVTSLAAVLMIAMLPQWRNSVPDDAFLQMARSDRAETAATAGDSSSGEAPRTIVTGRDRQDAADVDGDGRLDILDAFALARRIQTGSVRGTVGDQNGDGVVDEADVDLIAMSVVML
ncbi:MAG: dockerin type I domain-containing protein [Fuerstiella sp.]